MGLIRFVIDLVKQVQEEDLRLKEARIDLKLDKEKSDILHDKQENDLMFNAQKQLLKRFFTVYSVEAWRTDKEVLDMLSFEESKQQDFLQSKIFNYAHLHLTNKEKALLYPLKGAVTVSEATHISRSDFKTTEYILERLTASGYIEKGTKQGKTVYYCRDVFSNKEHPFYIEMLNYQKSLVDKENNAQRVKNKEFEQQEINDNIFEYAEKHLDKSSYRLFNLICLKGSLTVKEASKLLKCDTDKARYILEQLYEKRYIEKRKLEGNRNLYISKWG